MAVVGTAFCRDRSIAAVLEELELLHPPRARSNAGIIATSDLIFIFNPPSILLTIGYNNVSNILSKGQYIKVKIPIKFWYLYLIMQLIGK